jgi:putative ABC transport system ATP-binding protein
MIGLLDKPTGGTVNILDTDCMGMGDTALAHFRNANIGFVFQSFHLIPSLSVAANVELPLTYRSGLSASQRREKVEQVLERLGMTHRIKHLPTQLSGGQCQRVAIARAMVGAPQIILADEPTGNLDSKMGAEVMELLHRVNTEDGTTIVMVTHNEAQARDTDRIVRFFDGRIIS